MSANVVGRLKTLNFTIFFSGIAILQYTETFSLILLYCWYSYCVSFCVQLDGVCLSGN